MSDDYIRREDAYKALVTINEMISRFRECVNDVAEALDHYAQSADAKPVVHGTWSKEFDETAPAMFRGIYVCSACQCRQTYGRTSFCPNCGADMRNEDGTV